MSQAQSNNESGYILEINEAQLQVLSRACEMLARLGMGQTDMAFDALPQKPANEMDYSAWHEAQREIHQLLAPHLKGHVDGYQRFLSISSSEVAPQSQVAWDLHQVLRHKLAWDRARAHGVIKAGEPRKWPEMMTVNYDAPMPTADVPLAKVRDRSDSST